MADNLDDVFGETLEAAEPEIVQEPEATVEPAPETVEEPAPEPSQPVAEQPQRAEPGYVPIDAMLTEREKRQAAERELASYRAQAKPQDVPDPFDDPAGYQQHVDQRMNEGLQAQKANMSYALAVRDYGKDDVEAARAWALDKAQKDPLFGQQVETVFQNEMLPVDWVVQQHKRDALLTDIGDPAKIDDWFEREAAKRGFAKQNAPAPAAIPAAIPQQAAPPVKVPRSLATQGASPSDLRHVASGPLAGVDALFSA